MRLYIQTKDGQPINHPAFEENLMEAFGEIPGDWEPFSRVERPVLGVYQLLENQEAVYAKVDGIWTDVWSVREMTAQERQAVIDFYIKNAQQLVEEAMAQAITSRDLQATDLAKSVWQEYIDTLETFVVEDIFNPVLPIPPRLDTDGTPMSLNASGNAPNVID
jgi:hypothetical protein